MNLRVWLNPGMCWLGLLLTAYAVQSSALPDEGEAVRALEGRPCGNSTIGARLAEEIRVHSRRDLGWRMFGGDGYYDLERSLRVSKSMDMRFRWRISDDGTVEPVSQAAQRVCS